jgi:outer membrane protein
MRTLLMLILFSPLLLYSQNSTVWTLQNCIDSALENNSKIRLTQLDFSIADANFKSSKLSFLPTISGSASHGYNFGQTIDPFTNEFATNRVQYNNFYLSSSMMLFSGLSNHYNKKLSGLDQAILALNFEIEKRNISIDILSAYLQVKLNQEIALLKEKHLLFTTEQLRKIRLLRSVNYTTEQKLLEMQAQEAKDLYELTLVNNDLKKGLFLLQTLIGKTPDSTFQISDSITLDIQILTDELLLGKLQTERKIIEAKQIKGQLSPQLFLNGSLGSGYSENNKFLAPNGELIPKPFNEQLEGNFYQSISATLIIPIFSGADSYSIIKIKELEYQQIEIENQERVRQKENQILQYQLDIENQKEALKMLKKSFEAHEKLFVNAQIKYYNNSISLYDYLQSKEAFFNAESELIQATYRLEFTKLILLLFVQ